MSEKFDSTHWPVEIRLKKEEKSLEVDFDDGVTFDYPAEFLRVESPSAEVQGHGPSQKKTVPGCRYVGISEIEQVGNYAIRIRFDDQHDTGLYTWQYLYELGTNRERIWQSYLDALAAKGLDRDPFPSGN